MTAPHFSLDEPTLPTGRITLEASAGTGKTYTIVGLATRYLAEGACTARQLLVVTFARSATRELRERLLERIAAGLDVLTAALDGQPVGDDQVDRALIDADRTELAARRERLAQALADIDQATVNTIHGFCGEMLAVLGDRPAAGRLLEDDTALLTQIAGDLYLRALAEERHALPNFGFHGVELAQKGSRHDADSVLPTPSLTSRSGAPAWVAVNASQEFVRRKHQMSVHSHDDLLRRLAARLTDPADGQRAARMLGHRFTVALVDEFQDTDPTQWQIFSTLFPADGDATLVLVGDPKQAIYAFRGADVNAYVAARGAQSSFTLPINHRSDERLVTAVLGLFTGQPLGYGISVPAVTAQHRERLDRLGSAPVHLRMVADDAPVRRTSRGMGITSLRDHVARDVAVQAAAILGCGATITVDNGTVRSVVPDDIAVLVRTRRQATLVQQHLVAAGVPSILNGVGSVLESRAARDWAHLLRALDRPSASKPARLAALTDLIGWTPARIQAASTADWDALHINLHTWRGVLETDGVAAALRHLEAQTGLSARLVGQGDGQRRLTDLHHIAELLHAHASEELVGVPGLLAWLEGGIAGHGEAAAPVPDSRLASRLEQDGGALQIMTVHGAKGLQFGIVLAPFLWDSVGRTPVAFDVFDRRSGRRVLFAGDKNHADRQFFQDLWTQQSAEEERRLAYVAATRAKHHLRLWFGPASGVADSPLGTLLSRNGRVSTTAAATTAIAGLSETHPGCFEWSTVHAQATPTGDPLTPAPSVSVASTTASAPLAQATFGRHVDHVWRRSSYSRLAGQTTDSSSTTEAVQVDSSGGGAAISPSQVDTDVLARDDGQNVRPPAIPDGPAFSTPVPLATMRGGADIGTAIHAVLEHVDFAAPTLTEQLSRELARQVERHAIDLGEDTTQDAVVAGLFAALTTPLDAVDGPALVAVPRSHRLDEMAFEFGIDPAPTDSQDPPDIDVSAIARAMRRWLPVDDPIAGYPDLLQTQLADVPIRGFMAGYVDLILKIPGTQTFVVADYKTNRLGPPGADVLTAGHYTAGAMSETMQHHHYPLQAILYQVALHRYLRWRLPGYHPEVNLGGIAYLFLRGMVGPDTPMHDGMRCGVFRWRPPVGLIEELDRLFAGDLPTGDIPTADTASGGDAP